MRMATLTVVIIWVSKKTWYLPADQRKSSNHSRTSGEQAREIQFECHGPKKLLN